MWKPSLSVKDIEIYQFQQNCHDNWWDPW